MDGRGTTASAAVPLLDFKLGDIASLDITNNAYDVAIVHFVLRHVDPNVRHTNVNVLSRKL
jgi:ubiquinone/menaquinone biosynthesis C-methylase UbiE